MQIFKIIRILLLPGFLFLYFAACSQVPIVSAGTIKHFEKFPSKFVEARNVDVWLPPGYDQKKKYAVVYMQDGQMLFDSSFTWTRTEWKTDETVSRLLEEKKIKDCIIVGIWNTSAGRHADYFPQKAFELLPKYQQDSIYKANKTAGGDLFNNTTIHSDNYLRFMVSELKPFIDSAFSTESNRQNTFIA